jgi:outer membrane protein assembly factor BamB
VRSIEETDMKNFIAILAAAAFASLSLGAEQQLAWPRFRGPNGSGVADEQAPPVRLGPETNVKWKVNVPSGMSSPIVAGANVVLTAFENGKLYTIGQRRGPGVACCGFEPGRRLSPMGEAAAIDEGLLHASRLGNPGR